MKTLTDLFKSVTDATLDQSQKKFLLGYVVGLVVVLIAYVYLLLIPTIGRLAELFPKIRSRGVSLKQFRGDISFDDKLKKKLATLKEKLDETEEKLFSKKDIPKLLEDVSKMARESHLKIVELIPTEKSAKKKESIYEEVVIAINAQSAYHDLGGFLNKVENNKNYIMQVSRVRIEANKDNPRKHGVALTVVAYALKEKK